MRGITREAQPPVQPLDDVQAGSHCQAEHWLLSARQQLIKEMQRCNFKPDRLLEVLSRPDAGGQSPAANITALDRELSAMLAAGPGAPPSLVQLGTLLDQRLGQAAEFFDQRDALYRQVLLDPTLTAPDRAQVLAARHCFLTMAEQFKADLAYRLKAAASAMLAAQGTASDDRGPFSEALAQAQVFMQEMADDYLAASSLARSLQRSKVDQRSFRPLEQPTAAQQLGVFLGAGLTQCATSLLQFELARYRLAPQVIAFELLPRAIINGAAIGALNEALERTLKPLTLELGRWFGLADVKPLSASQVIPDPAPGLWENGEYRLRSDTEMAEARQQADLARDAFRHLAERWHHGTLSGDLVIYLIQTVGQLARLGLQAGGIGQPGSHGALIGSSGAAGFTMSGLQAWLQIRTHFEFEGRLLPTHELLQRPEGKASERLQALATRAATALNPLREDTRMHFASKVWSATEGMLPFIGLGLLIDRLPAGRTAGKVGKVALGGLQSLGLVVPLQSNKQIADQARRDGRSRFASAVANWRDPDRRAAEHGSRPGGIHRRLENTYHAWVRAPLQMPPQAFAQATEYALASGPAWLLKQIDQTLRSQLRRWRQPPPGGDLEAGPG